MKKANVFLTEFAISLKLVAILAILIPASILKGHIKTLLPSIKAFIETYWLLIEDVKSKKHLGSYVTVKTDIFSLMLTVMALGRNLAIHDYTSIEEMSDDIIKELASLYHHPDLPNAYGTVAIGSSEAIMLALLTYIYPFRQKGVRPNIIVPSTVHACFIKFATAFDVELRTVTVRNSIYTAAPEDIMKRVDKNTAAIAVILGSTYTGHLDDIERLNSMLRDSGYTVPIHVDAAIGGFIVPFAKPDLIWDFRLSHVKSISVSNHKGGHTFAGMGTVIFRDKAQIAQNLIFDIDYLGSAQKNFSLNFSRNAFNVVQQYYLFKKTSFPNGFYYITKDLNTMAEYLKTLLASTGLIEVINHDSIIPAVYFKGKAGFDIKLFAQKLKKKGYIIPVYKVPCDSQDVISRIVVKNSFTRRMAHDIQRILLKCR